MAKLVGVSSSPSPCLSRRQLPLTIEPGLTMIMALEDRCLACGHDDLEELNECGDEWSSFLGRFVSLSLKERSEALVVGLHELQSSAIQCIPCVGCRRSIDQLFASIVAEGKSGGNSGGNNAALQPLRVLANGHVSVDEEHIELPEAVSRLFTSSLRRLEQTCSEYQPKSCRRSTSTRCNSHSLQQSSKMNSAMEVNEWLDVWNSMESECQAEVALLPFTLIKTTVDKYLRRHSFCVECSAMVNKAFNLLIDMDDGEDGSNDISNEKERSPPPSFNKGAMEFRKSLFKGLNPCKREQHLHVSCEESLLSRLMAMADPDVGGLKQERHAKTMELAQKEILICIGIAMYERLARIKHKLREAQQTFDQLFMVALMSLKRSCEVACDHKTGLDDVDRICDELDRDEKEKKAKESANKRKEAKKANNNNSSNVKKKKTSNGATSSNGVDSSKNVDGVKKKGEKKKLTSTSKQNKTCNKQEAKQNKQKTVETPSKTNIKTASSTTKTTREPSEDSRHSSKKSSSSDEGPLGEGLSLLQLSHVLDDCLDSPGTGLECCLSTELGDDLIVCSENMRKQREKLRLKLRQGFDALCQDVSTGRRPFIPRA